MQAAAYNKAIDAWKVGNVDDRFAAIFAAILDRFLHQTVKATPSARREIGRFRPEPSSLDANDDHQPPMENDAMPMTPTATNHVPSPPLAFGGRPLEAISDDECVTLLAEAVDEHDASHLDEVACLIARLAVPIEL